MDALLARLARRMTDALPTDRRVLVAIDGVDGSGKTTFAEELRTRVEGREVIVIHADDFLNPAAVRHARGRSSPAGFWLDSYDYTALERDVLVPLGRGGDGVHRMAGFDARNSAAVDAPQRCASDDAVTLVEGMFLHRERLVGRWDFSVFLDVPFEETALRMSLRDGTDPDPSHASMRRYVGGQLLYFETRPWERASVIVDNRDPDHRRLLEGDATAAAAASRTLGGLGDLPAPGSEGS